MDHLEYSLFLTLSRRYIDQFNNLFDGIVELAALHCLDETLLLIKCCIDCIKKLFVRQLFLLNDNAVALLLKGGSI